MKMNENDAKQIVEGIARTILRELTEDNKFEVHNRDKPFEIWCSDSNQVVDCLEIANMIFDGLKLVGVKIDEDS